MNATTWGTYASWVSAAIQLVALAFSILVAYLIWVQLALAQESLKQDHKRRKAEATLKAVKEAIPNLVTGEHALIGLGDDLTRTDFSDVSVDPAKSIIKILDELEWLAVGFRSGAYDRVVGIHMMGTWYSELVERLTPAIEQIRTSTKRPMAYCDCQVVADEFRSVDNMTRPRGSGPRSFPTDIQF